MNMGLRDKAIFYVKNWSLMVYPWSIRGCFWYVVGRSMVTLRSISGRFGAEVILGLREDRGDGVF
jgi:hypothetical protein